MVFLKNDADWFCWPDAAFASKFQNQLTAELGKMDCNDGGLYGTQSVIYKQPSP
jgi:hypothetical protein